MCRDHLFFRIGGYAPGSLHALNLLWFSKYILFFIFPITFDRGDCFFVFASGSFMETSQRISNACLVLWYMLYDSSWILWFYNGCKLWFFAWEGRGFIDGYSSSLAILSHWDDSPGFGPVLSALFAILETGRIEGLILFYYGFPGLCRGSEKLWCIIEYWLNEPY